MHFFGNLGIGPEKTHVKNLVGPSWICTEPQDNHSFQSDQCFCHLGLRPGCKEGRRAIVSGLWADISGRRVNESACYSQEGGGGSNSGGLVIWLGWAGRKVTAQPAVINKTRTRMSPMLLSISMVSTAAPPTPPAYAAATVPQSQPQPNKRCNDSVACARLTWSHLVIKLPCQICTLGLNIFAQVRCHLAYPHLIRAVLHSFADLVQMRLVIRPSWDPAGAVSKHPHIHKHKKHVLLEAWDQILTLDCFYSAQRL